MPSPSLDAGLRAIYPANASESLNYQLRKFIKNRGHYPKDDAVIKRHGPHLLRRANVDGFRLPRAG
jgi:transposase-like protein